MKRRVPLRKLNPERLAKRRAEQFGAYAEWIRTLPCCVTGRWPVEAAHVLSRGAGGKAAANLVPLVWTEHRALHFMGRWTYEEKRGINLSAEARRLWTLYRSEP